MEWDLLRITITRLIQHILPNKIAKGCKGIGRFLWLLAFDHAEIDSVYREDGNVFRRIFVFSDKGPTPEDNVVPESDKSNIITTIKLCEYKAVFQENCPLGLEVLAKKIVEHCLPFFISGNCPRITIQDGVSPSVELNSYFHSIIEPTLHQDKFELNNEVFRTCIHKRLSKVWTWEITTIDTAEETEIS